MAAYLVVDTLLTAPYQELLKISKESARRTIFVLDGL
jgi:hypothetical protein